MQIEHTSTPANQDIDFLAKQINQETTDFGSAYPFAFLMQIDFERPGYTKNASCIFLKKNL